MRIICRRGKHGLGKSGGFTVLFRLKVPSPACYCAAIGQCAQDAPDGRRLTMSMNVSNVDSLLTQMRAAVAAAQGNAVTGPQSAGAAGGVDFSQVLRSSLDGVNQMQRESDAMQKAFILGDDKVSLSDTMIAMQKANISFQTAVQVRNKFVAAYTTS
jgi:flagellar hook-basal body complex protein FliE